jgi:hypothetical protein
MLFNEIISVYTDMRIILNPYIQNTELMIVEAGGTYSYRSALQG